MFVFGTAVTDLETYDAYAAPGIRRAAEPDSKVFAHQSAGTLFRNYNVLLDKAAEMEGLEALVLLHQDAELVDDDFCDRVRPVLSDPDVGVVGCAGAIGVRSIAWWEGAVTWASFTHRYSEFGGGDIESLSWASGPSSIAETGEVDSIDGFVMVLSPWAVRELRFDESLGRLHGYDFDFCGQVRLAGKKVMTADFRAIHHHSLDLISNPDAWIESYVKLAERYEDKLGTGNGSVDWRTRALRAEAEAAAAKGESVSNRLRYEAVRKHLKRIQRSSSWRVTAPLRGVKQWLRRRRG